MKYLFWLDMEMTGLDFEKDRILEVALIVTDLKFEILDTFETVVFQDSSVLKNMNDWCVKHHVESGLTDKVALGVPEHLVEENLIKFVQKYQSQDKLVLAGNTIGQDRKFIDKWMPNFASILHYRMLDVSSFKIVFEEIYNKNFKKQKKHRAIDDILESIGELKFYLNGISIN